MTARRSPFTVHVFSQHRPRPASIEVQATDPSDALRRAFDHRPDDLEIVEIGERHAAGRIRPNLTAWAHAAQTAETPPEARPPLPRQQPPQAA